MAEFSSPVLNAPIAVLTGDLSQYGKMIRFTVTDLSPIFWENDCLLVYVQSGTGQLMVNQTVYQVGKGDVCILHSFHVFQFCAAQKEPLLLKMIIYPYAVMSYMDVGLSLEKGGFPDLCAISPCLHPDETFSETIQRVFETYQEESVLHDSTSIYMQHCVCAQAVCQYYNAFLDGCPPTAALLDPLGKRIFEFIYFGCYNQITAKGTADHFGISVRHMNLELRRLCGAPFLEVLQNARVNSACAMMLRKGITFQRIAKETGFPSEATFYRTFFEAKGCTPQAYQDQLLGIIGNRDRQFQSDVLTEVHKYILNNFRLPITLKTCSEALYLPRSLIEQTQKAQYGKDSTFPSLLRSVRLEYAKGLLSSTKLPIYDVAEEAGFNSLHTFIRLFKREIGMTPTQFREVIQDEQVEKI